jgi:glycosyltransferase involved in cell wall biosynthesis
MVVSELSARLADRGHAVTVITSTRGGESRYQDEFVGKVRVIRIPERFHLFEAPLIPQIALRALFVDFDVLHVHGMSPTITDLGIIIGKLRRKPVVLTYHNDAESTLEWDIAKVAAHAYARLSLSILSMADSVVCSTRSYAASSLALKHFRGRFEVIPLGVDTSRFAKTGLRPAPSERREVLFVGQLKEYKGIGFLIEAVAKLRRGGRDVILRIVGEGPSYPRLAAIAETLGIEDYVRFMGNVGESKLIDYYDSCDLVVLPSISRREAFGLVQLEASAAGKAVVASDIPGVGDVTRMVGGFLAKPSDVDSLALQIENAFASKHDGKKQKETAATMSWEVVTTEYEELFQSLLKGLQLPALEPSSSPEPQAPLTKVAAAHRTLESLDEARK